MPDPHRLPHEKGFHISWDQIHRDSRALAWRLDGLGPDGDAGERGGGWRAVVAITRGGMAPAMIVVPTAPIPGSKIPSLPLASLTDVGFFIGHP